MTFWRRTNSLFCSNKGFFYGSANKFHFVHKIYLSLSLGCEFEIICEVQVVQWLTAFIVSKEPISWEVWGNMLLEILDA